jgi:hypothetical protein
MNGFEPEQLVSIHNPKNGLKYTGEVITSGLQRTTVLADWGERSTVQTEWCRIATSEERIRHFTVLIASHNKRALMEKAQAEELQAKLNLEITGAAPEHA